MEHIMESLNILQQKILQLCIQCIYIIHIIYFIIIIYSVLFLVSIIKSHIKTYILGSVIIGTVIGNLPHDTEVSISSISALDTMIDTALLIFATVMGFSCLTVCAMAWKNASTESMSSNLNSHVKQNTHNQYQ